MGGNIVTKNQYRNLNKLLGLLSWVVFGVTILSHPSLVVGQSNPAVGQSANQEKFDTIMADWKTAAKAAAIAGTEFALGSRGESAGLHEKWREAVTEGNRQMNLLVPVAIDLYNELSEPPTQLTELLIRIAESEYNKGKYGRAFELSGLILEAKPDDERVLTVRMGSAAMSNRFEVAKELKEVNVAALENQVKESSRLLADIDTNIEQFNEEQELWAKESEADDLPRVKFKTTKGTIEVELFENEAPETVGNFISLVERGAYTDMIFHRVINHFMAQTGVVNSRGQRLDIGYMIYDECGKVDARRHFRGSLSMAKTGDPHSGNSQFFFNFAPTPFLNNRHTVFGRVISGWDALDRISRTHEIVENGDEKIIEGSVPDRIITAKVIRKRDHEYKPVPVD